MAGEQAKQAAQRVQDKADELMAKAADKEQQVARLRNEVGEERREAAREVVDLANPGNETTDAARLVESQQEISSHKARIDSLESEIVGLKNESNRLSDVSRTLIGLAETAEAAEGEANDAASRALAEI